MPATGIVAVATKQTDLAVGLILVETVQGDRRHCTFVLFVGAVNIEIAQTDDLATGRGQLPAYTLVEKKFRVAVNIQRPLILALLAKNPTGAIYRCRRRIQHRHLQALGSIKQVATEAVVVVHHKAPIAFDGAGARALM
ncbi:hypothetical protein D3C77_633720 [compost metagenome]